MILGALVSSGASLAELEHQLQALPVSGYTIAAGEERRGPISGTRVHVSLDDAAQPRRSLADISSLLAASALPPGVVARATEVFTRLATAEAKVHGMPLEEVHFHEVGAVDAIVDVVGGLLALDLLGVEQVYCSAFPVAPGTVQTSHGMLPLPAPATLELIAAAEAAVRDVSAVAQDLGELVTPTAAAILTTVATFSQPPMTLQRIGYGVGARSHPALPNVLRVWLGETAADVATETLPAGQVQVLETNIDDMNPELYGYVAEQLFAAGALDVWYTPVQMKKGRPGTQISVLSRLDKAADLAALLLRETSTLGVRTTVMARWEAERSVVQFASTLGPAAVKVKRWQGELVQVAPEYESCRALALESGLPLAEVYRRLEAEGRAFVLAQQS